MISSLREHYTDANSRDVTHALGDAHGPPEALQPLPAAAFLEVELRELVSELRAVIADLRAENRRLREELGQRDADVVSLDAERGKRR